MFNSVRIGALGLLLANIAGCISTAQYQSWSAGQTGCSPETIQVSEPKPVTGGIMWHATCAGKTYLCTELESGVKSSQTSCAAAVN